MMNKSATRDSRTNRQFKHQIYQSKRRAQSRNFYDECNYNRGKYQNRYRLNAEIGESNLVDKIEVDQGMNRTIGMIIGEEILEVM